MIEDYAFKDRKNITLVYISDGVKSIGNSAFENCTSLTNVSIPTSVTSIGKAAFSGCTGLVKITVPSSVKVIEEYTFLNCKSLASVNISEGVTTIKKFAFKDCDALTQIIIPKGVTTIGESAFETCNSLTSVVIPEGVTAIEAYTFWRCENLESITLPDSVTRIVDNAFNDTAYYNNYRANWINGALYIGNHVIVAKSTLSYGYRITDGTKSIADSAFAFCYGITNITIPNSVTHIGAKALNNCRGITTIVFRGTMSEWEAIQKDEDWNANTGDYIIECTDGEIEKSADK